MKCENTVIDGFEVICLDTGEVLGYVQIPHENAGRIRYTYISPIVEGRNSIKHSDLVKKHMRLMYDFTNYDNVKRIRRIINEMSSRMNLDESTKRKIEATALSYLRNDNKRVKGNTVKYYVLMSIIDHLGIQSGITASEILGLGMRGLTFIFKKYNVSINGWDPSVYVNKFFSDISDSELKNKMIMKSLEVFFKVRDIGVRHGLREYLVLKTVCSIVRSRFLKNSVSKRILKYGEILRLNEVLAVEY